MLLQHGIFNVFAIPIPLIPVAQTCATILELLMNSYNCCH